MNQEISITQIELYKLFIPLKEPFVISLGPIYNAENVLIRKTLCANARRKNFDS